jgi:hypothetical protein
LKGPLPAAGNIEGLARAAIKDALYNTATKALFVDLTGLTAEQAATVEALVKAGAARATKAIFFLR